MLRLLKFAIVGGLGTLMNELVFLSTTKLLSISISLALAIEISIVFNFMLNDVWTFKDKRKGNIWKRLRELPRPHGRGIPTSR